jgi:hypothetical protein
MNYDTIDILCVGIPAVIATAFLLYGVIAFAWLKHHERKYFKTLATKLKNMNFRTRLIEVMRRKRLDDRAVARLTGASAPTVMDWMEGKCTPYPTLMEEILTDLEKLSTGGHHYGPVINLSQTCQDCGYKLTIAKNMADTVEGRVSYCEGPQHKESK